MIKKYKIIAALTALTFILSIDPVGVNTSVMADTNIIKTSDYNYNSPSEVPSTMSYTDSSTGKTYTLNLQKKVYKQTTLTFPAIRLPWTSALNYSQMRHGTPAGLTTEYGQYTNTGTSDLNGNITMLEAYRDADNPVTVNGDSLHGNRQIWWHDGKTDVKHTHVDDRTFGDYYIPMGYYSCDNPTTSTPMPQQKNLVFTYNGVTYSTDYKIDENTQSETSSPLTYCDWDRFQMFNYTFSVDSPECVGPGYQIPYGPYIDHTCYEMCTVKDIGLYSGTLYSKAKWAGVYSLNVPDQPSQPSGGQGGEITFSPPQCSWTNIGKTNGYPVMVTLDKPVVVHQWVQNYTKSTTTTTWSSSYTPPVPPDKDGKGGSAGGWSSPVYSSNTVTTNIPVTFNVTYTANPIAISGGCTPSTVSNSGGQILVPEGGYRYLSASTTYVQKKDTPVAPQPDPDCLTGDEHNGSKTTSAIEIGELQQVDPPKNPTGNAGPYNVDYTDPLLSLDEPSSYWINTDLNVNINAFDPPGKYNPSGQSGLRSANYFVSDSSHYYRNSSGSFSGNSSINLSDGMYKINLNDSDIAGNTNQMQRQTYYVDTTAPTALFSVPSGIFQGTGVTRKPSQHGTNDGFYGTLTLNDNLSGINSVSYAWAFSDSDSGASYTNIYTSPYTYTDRYQESITREIEKPVGDRLFLHVKVQDTAGNLTYKVFGPYEDPIKLKSFEVTDVKDPAWDSVFWKDPVTGGFKDPTKVVYPVNKLPIDGDSHPTLKNAFPKKGYAFYFDITSEYLYRDKDRIEIVPTFYYYDGKSRVRVDCYYNLNNNPLTEVGSKLDTLTLNLNTNKYGKVLIGNLPKLTLTEGVRIDKGKEWSQWKGNIQYTDGKIQWWYGKYFLPPTSIFVKHGETPRPENVLNKNYIIINFEIVGYKNGIETLSQDQIYSYVENNWVAEGGPKSSNYQPGDVMVYDNTYSTLSDYKAYIIQ